MHGQCRRNLVDAETAVKSMGLNSLHGAALTLLSSMREYGLIDRPSGKVALTALAVRIVHPTSDQQREEAIREAALSPKVFQTLLKNFGDCSENVLESHLVQSAFTPIRAKQVAKVFIANKAFAKLSSESSVDVLELEEDGETLAGTARSEVKKADSALSLATPLQATAASETASPSTITPPAGNSFSFKGEMLAQYNIPLGGNQAYLAFTGKELVPEDFDALVDFVEFTKKQFVRALQAEEAARKKQEVLDGI